MDSFCFIKSNPFAFAILPTISQFPSHQVNQIKIPFNCIHPKELINFSCRLSANLASVWTSGDYYQKKIFQNVVFPSGLVYDTKIEHYRTTEVNRVIARIADLSKGLREIKKSEFSKTLEKSGLVPPSRPNVNELLEDTRDLARIWDLYGHLLKKD